MQAESCYQRARVFHVQVSVFFNIYTLHSKFLAAWSHCASWLGNLGLDIDIYLWVY